MCLVCITALASKCTIDTRYLIARSVFTIIEWNIVYAGYTQTAATTHRRRIRQHTQQTITIKFINGTNNVSFGLYFKSRELMKLT